MSKLSFQAVLLANEQRNAYGLRYNDYERYRKHCANRTHRLRSSLKMTHGKGREFKKLAPVALDDVQDGHLQLLLFEAERAWAYSREFSQLATLPANKDKASVLRRNATSRFRKSVNWATQLLSQCQGLHASGRLSASGLIQSTVYTLILNGRFLRHRYEFEDALAQLSVARALLDELASHAVTSRDQALATAFADEIGPEIRHCAHELGNEKAYDVDAIVPEVAKKHKAALVEGYDGLVEQLTSESAGSVGVERSKLAPLTWEDEPVPVRNPELVDVLLKVQEAEERLRQASDDQEGPEKEKSGKSAQSKRGVAAYDAVLLALSDAEGVARKLAEAQQLNGGSSTGTSGTRDLQFVHSYITYQLLSKRIQRDILLISTILHQQQSQNTRSDTTKAKPTKEQVDVRLYPAVVKLLDTIIQGLTQMRALTIIDDNPDLATAVDARISFTKADKCRYLARSYLSVKKYPEALTLMQHASLHLREARSSLSLLPEPEEVLATPSSSFLTLTDASITTLENELEAESLQCKKDWFNYNGGDASGTIDRKTYKKPLFFDIALNYVALNMDRLQERAGKTHAAPAPPIAAPQPQRAPAPAEARGPVGKAKAESIVRPATPEPSSAPTKGGLSSLLGGWWGRS